MFRHKITWKALCTITTNINPYANEDTRVIFLLVLRYEHKADNKKEKWKRAQRLQSDLHGDSTLET